jgi:GNAT superfamily N-acetyltransferase
MTNEQPLHPVADAGAVIVASADEQGTLLVYEAGGEALGRLQIRERQWPKGRKSGSIYRYAEVTGLQVVEHARRRGIGRELMKAALEWAGAQGFERVSVEASARAPRSAVAFYEAVGFTQRSVVLDVSLSEGRQDEVPADA